MAERDELARGYAEAMFQVAEAEGELEAVETQLYAFAKLLERDTRVREALIDPALPVENKRGLIADTLGERANPIAVNLLALLVEQGRARDIARIVQDLALVTAERRAHVLAEVRSAVPLDDGQRRRLAEALSTATGRQVEVKVVVDPTVVGGVVARVGDEIFDGSVKSRLDEAKQHLSA
ncbi:MAG: ATP synthase F1 subunit delta [Actinomycetota bacterium]